MWQHLVYPLLCLRFNDEKCHQLQIHWISWWEPLHASQDSMQNLRVNCEQALSSFVPILWDHGPYIYLCTLQWRQVWLWKFLVRGYPILPILSLLGNNHVYKKRVWKVYFPRGFMHCSQYVELTKEPIAILIPEPSKICQCVYWEDLLAFGEEFSKFLHISCARSRRVFDGAVFSCRLCNLTGAQTIISYCRWRVLSRQLQGLYT